mmetsp:Transcript_34417/g.76465  ORF Transcript_34417/g.76465 Transcript_34417/m.76465 type:complete len:228 (-) Transcript_34417:479-1162(-)
MEVAEARVECGNCLNGQQIPVVLGSLVLVGQCARPGRELKHPPGALLVFQVPRGAFCHIKAVVPVLVKGPAANLELQTIVHQLGNTCGLVGGVVHDTCVPVMPDPTLGAGKGVAVHLTDPGFATLLHVLISTQPPGLWVLPHILSDGKPQRCHLGQIIFVHEGVATHHVTVSAIGSRKRVVALSDLRDVPGCQIIGTPYHVGVVRADGQPSGHVVGCGDERMAQLHV